MSKLFPLILAIFCLSGCATPPQGAPSLEPAAIAAYRQEHLTLEQTERRIFGPLEDNLQKLNARLKQDISTALREQVLTDRDLLEKDIVRRRQIFTEQIAVYNSALDEIWTYRTPQRTQDGRGGESGIILIQKDKITHLQRVLLD